MTECVKEAVWLSELMHECFALSIAPVQIMADNQGSIALSKDPKYHGRTKHIRIRFHYIRECIINNAAKLSFIPTKEMLADIFTKPLGKDLFNKFKGQLGMSA